MGWYLRFQYALDPFVNFLYATPRIVLIPLFIIWFGIDWQSKVAVIFLGALFPMIINTMAGVRNTDAALLRVARSFGASETLVFRRVVLPGAVPFILTGLRLGVGHALTGVVVAELVAARHGIGKLISDFFPKIFGPQQDQPLDAGALRDVASILMKDMREIDTVARYGGEEFCLVLPGAAKMESIFVAERIRRGIEKESFLGEEGLPSGRLTASIGISSFPEDGQAPIALINSADIALYQAKDQGRNRIVIYNNGNSREGTGFLLHAAPRQT